MDCHLFKAQVRFNGGTRHSFKVHRYHAKGSQGSTERNQLRTQPRRHKEGGGPSVCTSRKFAGPKDNVGER